MQHQQEEAILRGLKANRRQGYGWRQNESCAIRAQCDNKAYREKLNKNHNSYSIVWHTWTSSERARLVSCEPCG
nr:MAG TPA: hypothetical protein [Caudoviricetes sp.]